MQCCADAAEPVMSILGKPRLNCHALNGRRIALFALHLASTVINAIFLQNRNIQGVLMKSFTGLTFVIALFSICGFLNAETIYQTGFEKPTYSTGGLSGHNGWTSTGGSIGVVEKTFAYSGSQAVLYDTSARAGQYDDIYNFSYNSINNPNQLVTLSVEAYFTGDSNEIWEALGPDSSNGFMGQIQVQDGYATFGLADTNIGAVPVTFNSWNQYSMVFDYSTDTEAAYINGILIGSSSFVAPGSTDLTDNWIGYSYKYGKASDSGYFDDLSITATTVPAPVPEPADFSLVACGLLAGLGAFRGRILSAVLGR
jgi:hypothetical protein